MGIDDLLSFDAPLYTTKIRSLSTPDLQAREITKTRQFLSGSCTAGLGLGTAAATGGISLGFTALAGRNMQIAMAKLEIIKAELARRGVPTRDKLSTGDIVVPAVGGVVGMVVGAGVEGEMVEDHGIGEAIGPTAGEIVAANVVGGRVAAGVRWAVEQGGEDKAREWFGCARLGGAGLERNRVWCDECRKVIKGLYAHCCQCDDQWDLCMECVRKREGSMCKSKDGTHHVVFRQIAVYGYCDQEMAVRDIEVKRKGGSLACGHCKTSITQGRAYVCKNCPVGDSPFSLCINCYHAGETCPSPEKHRLFVFLAARMPQQGNVSPYERSHGTATPGCDKCGKSIRQGAYYQCDQDGCRQSGHSYFDLCHACYETGDGCNNTSHQLTQYFAYRPKPDNQPSYRMGSRDCDNCSETIRDDEYYHCRGCNNNNFDLCMACYFTGHGCKDKNHKLVKMSQ